MFDEFKKSINASLYERAASPIIGSFVSAWLIFNWKLCFVIAFANDTIYERLAYLEKSPYIGMWPNLYLPAISAAIFIGLYPLVSLLPYMWWEWYAKQKTKIKNNMQRSVLISLEKSIELRNEIENQEEKFEEMLKSKEQRNTELLVINDNLQKSLSEKEEINNQLRKQLQDEVKKQTKKNNVSESVKKASPENTFPFHTPNSTEPGSFIHKMRNANEISESPSSEKKLEIEWDAEFDSIMKNNPYFADQFNEAIESIINNSGQEISPNTKKVCLIHGVIELTDEGRLIITAKGQYMARKIL